MSIHVNSGWRVALALAPVLLAGNAFAQQQVCVEVQGGKVNAFRIERRVPLTAFSTTQTPDVPPDLLAAITSGALEVRERLFYNPQSNVLTSTWFTQAPAATFPTPLALDLTQSTVQVFSIDVTRILATQKPVNNVLFTGLVHSVDIPGPFGDFTGAPATVSAAYVASETEGGLATISNVLLNIAGVFASYTQGGSGDIDITYPPTGGGGGGGGGEGGPKADAGTGGTVVDYSIVLDGTKSTGKAPLSFSWGMAAGSKTAAISGGNTATPTVSFGEGFGDYVFELTVTDADGETDKATVTFSYQGRS